MVHGLTLVVAMVFLSKMQAVFHDKWTQTNLLLTGDKINYLLFEKLIKGLNVDNSIFENVTFSPSTT